MALCTIEDLYLYLGLGDAPGPSNFDSTAYRYQLLIDAISDEIEKYCNRRFNEAAYTEYQSGEGTRYLLLDQYPILSLTSATITYPTTTNETDVDTDNIVIDRDRGQLYYLYGWEKGFNNVKVIYSAGYETIPDDLALIAMKMVSDAYDNSTVAATTMQEEKIGDYSYKRSANGIKFTDDNKIILNRYVRHS